MKTGIALGLVSLFAAGVAFAQAEPVVGVKDPESLFKSSDAKLNRNKQAALHIERELLQCGQWDRAGEWLTDAYHQHNPNAASGLKGVIFFFTQVMKVKKTEPCGPLTAPVVGVFAEGDYVTVLTATREMDDPNNPGKKYNTSWFDTWRFVDGKADEHWDPATITPRPAAAK
jgi:predicted SnoaL-like aldol condensation-catalyzing enzyme